MLTDEPTIVSLLLSYIGLRMRQVAMCGTKADSFIPQQSGCCLLFIGMNSLRETPHPSEASEALLKI
jgi:hypothetical protein